MTTNIDNIIILNEQELVTTSIDGYFKNVAIIAEFENSDLVSGVTFATDGYEEYTTLAGIAAVFPTTHIVYKLAQDILNQKANTGINKSNIEKIAVIQVKSTDTSYEAALTRIGYNDAYHMVCASNDKADIVSVSDYILSRRKIAHLQTSDADVLTDVAGNVAETLKDGSYNRSALQYHSEDTEGLAAVVASIMCSSTPGKTSGQFLKPSGLTSDTLTEPQIAKLDGNNVNYYTDFTGQAGSYIARTLTNPGILSGGTKMQKTLQIDRIVLNLQSAGMDAFESQISYDDRGGTVLEGYLKSVLTQLQNEGIISVDSVDDAGDVLQGFTLEVLSVAETKTSYVSLYNQQIFVVKAEVTLALNAEKVEIYLAY